MSMVNNEATAENEDLGANIFKLVQKVGSHFSFMC